MSTSMIDHPATAQRRSPPSTASLLGRVATVDAGLPDGDGIPLQPGATVASPYSPQGAATASSLVASQVASSVDLPDPAGAIARTSGTRASTAASSASSSRERWTQPEPTTYEIVLRDRPSARLLRPLLDVFTFDHGGDGVTRLVGETGDCSHLHGVLAHLTSADVDVVSIGPAPAVHHEPTTTHGAPS